MSAERNTPAQIVRDQQDERLIEQFGECFVYVIGIDIVDGPQKIGIARDMTQRLRGIQNGCPLPLVINSTLRTDRDTAFRVEHGAHTLLKPYRMKGEWFRVSPEIASRAVRTALIQYRGIWPEGGPYSVSNDLGAYDSWGPSRGRQPGTSPPEKKRTRRGPSIRSFG